MLTCRHSIIYRVEIIHVHCISSITYCTYRKVFSVHGQSAYIYANSFEQVCASFLLCIPPILVIIIINYCYYHSVILCKTL